MRELELLEPTTNQILCPKCNREVVGNVVVTNPVTRFAVAMVFPKGMGAKLIQMAVLTIALIIFFFSLVHSDSQHNSHLGLGLLRVALRFFLYPVTHIVIALAIVAWLLFFSGYATCPVCGNKKRLRLREIFRIYRAARNQQINK